MQAFNINLAGRVTGATERELRYWDAKGIVKPSISGAAGRGSRRLYSFLDLVQARAAKELRAGGLSLQRLRKALHALREHPDQIRHPLAELSLVTDGKTVFRVTDDPRVWEEIRRTGQLVSALAIKPLCDHVRDRLAERVRRVMETVEVAGRKYKTVVQADVVDGGYIAECPSLRGCVTDGETPEEALRNLRDAIQDWHAAGRSRHLAKAE